MPNPDLLQLLAQGVPAWNAWRAAHPDAPVDLRGLPTDALRPLAGKLDGINLRGALLAGADLAYVDLNQADLSGADLQAALLTSAGLKSATLAGARLGQAKLSFAKLDGADLHAADLEQADLAGASLAGANLSDANLQRIRGEQLGLEAANLQRTRLAGAQLMSADFTRVDARDADFSGAFMAHAHLLGADLRGARLNGADLRHAMLVQARLAGATLTGADFSRANLSLQMAQLPAPGAGAGTGYGSPGLLGDFSGVDFSATKLCHANLAQLDLRGARLVGADLTGAVLDGALLTGADLSGADLSCADMVETDFSGATLSGCRVYGVSAWNVLLDGAVQHDLVISKHGEAEITVDDLEVAQFIYLLLNNSKIRNVINTLTSKGVLILGRFADPQRKAVLDGLRQGLRQFDLLPMVFDFDRPTDKDYTETVQTLAGMSLFVIADVTSPKSTPLELEATAKQFKIPYLPILDTRVDARPFAMLVDLQKSFHWVLPTLQYSSTEELLDPDNLQTYLIDRAMAKREELRQAKSAEPAMLVMRKRPAAP